MKETLRRKLAETIEFEYIGRGHWDHQGCSSSLCVAPGKRVALRDVLQSVERYGYECYLQTRGGLVPVAGKCWDDRLGRIGWVNVLCAHDPRAHALFRSSEFAPSISQLVRNYRVMGGKAHGRRGLNATIREDVMRRFEQAGWAPRHGS
jgi:hypothetical protein